MKDLFVYGSLMNKEVSQYFFDDSINCSKAILQGYIRVFVSGCEYPALKQDKTGTVQGILLHDLSDEQITTLDEFEGRYYERKSGIVTIESEKKIKGEIYFLKEKYKKLLSDEVWDNILFREKFLQKFLDECLV